VAGGRGAEKQAGICFSTGVRKQTRHKTACDGMEGKHVGLTKAGEMKTKSYERKESEQNGRRFSPVCMSRRWLRAARQHDARSELNIAAYANASRRLHTNARWQRQHTSRRPREARLVTKNAASRREAGKIEGARVPAGGAKARRRRNPASVSAHRRVRQSSALKGACDAFRALRAGCATRGVCLRWYDPAEPEEASKPHRQENALYAASMDIMRSYHVRE